MKKISSFFAVLFCLHLIAFSSGSRPFCLSYESFTATKTSDCAATLAWVYNQCNAGVFYVQYSVDGATWYNIGVVNSTGSIGSEQSYTYVDNYACPGNSSYTHAFYRLWFVKAAGVGSDVSIVTTVSFPSCSCSSNNTTRCSSIPSIGFSGNTTICPGGTQTYTLSNSAYGATWSITSGSNLVNITSSDPSQITLTATGNGSVVFVDSFLLPAQRFQGVRDPQMQICCFGILLRCPC